MSSVPLRRSNRGKKPEETATHLPNESGVRGVSVNVQRVLRSGKKSSEENNVPTSSGSPGTPKKNANYTHWKRGKVVRSGVNDLTKDVAASASNVNDLSKDVAPSASNPIYQQKYGHLGSDDDLESDDDEDDDYRADLSEDEGGDDDDDDDFVDIDVESDDEGRSLFPKNKTPRNYLSGGPQKTDTTGMTEEEAGKIREADRKKRKKWTDAERKIRIKANPIGSPPRANRGITTDTLRMMTEVEAHRLSDGHMFPTKEIFWIRIAEEAILRNISVRSLRSDHMQMKVIGKNFFVSGYFREGYGWTCTAAVCREGDDVNSIPNDDLRSYESLPAPPSKTPLSHLWVVPIIRSAVEKNPGVDYEALRNLIRPYAKDYSITNALVQDARDAAKRDIFGKAEENVMHAEKVAEEMRKQGHIVELVFTTRKETLANINMVVLQEEVEYRKRNKLPALDDADARKQFWLEWKRKNGVMLANSLGIEGGPLESKFLSGILVVPSNAKHMFPTTQEVVQADAAHTSFGKYTLFSAYTSTANGNMANVAYAILFGNEDTKNWMLFCSFMAREHPTINRPQVTILTDQDKGSINAIQNCIPQAHNFHCAFHRRQNIITKCGGGSGKKPGTALWLYNKLSSCPNMTILRAESNRFLDELHPTDRHYLTKIDDTKQYPAARCAMGPGICMYGKSASSGVESMNRANKQLVRMKTAVDILNASLLLLKLEGDRFNAGKEKAWNC